MRSVTEFPTHILTQGLKNREALVAEGKTPEEVQAGIGEAHKYEGDKLKHFMNAMEVASQNPEKLRRVLVVSYAEGEKVHEKALKVDEMHYVPDLVVAAKPPAAGEAKGKGNARGGGGRDNKRSGPKESPWGLSPEEKAEKKQRSANAAAAKEAGAATKQ